MSCDEPRVIPTRTVMADSPDVRRWAASRRSAPPTRMDGGWNPATSDQLAAATHVAATLARLTQPTPALPSQQPLTAAPAAAFDQPFPVGAVVVGQLLALPDRSRRPYP